MPVRQASAMLPSARSFIPSAAGWLPNATPVFALVVPRLVPTRWSAWPSSTARRSSTRSVEVPGVGEDVASPMWMDQTSREQVVDFLVEAERTTYDGEV